MNYYAKANNLIKGDEAATGEDFREGLTAIVSAKLADPHFEAQTKVRLTNPEVGSFVETVVNEQLGHYIEEHPAEAKRILSKAIQAAAAREAARKARELTRRKGRSAARVCQASSGIVQTGKERARSYSWSKATPQAAPPKAAGIKISRRYCP